MSASSDSKHRKLVGSAIKSNAIELLRKYHKRGIDVSACSYRNNDATTEKSMVCAAFLGHIGVIKLLHELGCNVITMSSGFSPMLAASQGGHINAIRTLYKLGANVNTPDNKGFTPVYAAASKGHVDAVRTLCELGADVNTPNNKGCTPVHAAATEGHEKVVTLLRKFGAKMDEQSDFGTAADAAAKMGHTVIQAKLAKYNSCCANCVEAGTNVNLSLCSRCNSTYYCSAACQKQDWKKHKLMCRDK